MKFKSGRAVHIYYSVMSLACAILLGTGIAYFWKTGAVNPHRLSLVYEASHHLDEVKKRDDIVRVKKLTDLDRVRDAVKIMDRISVDIKKLNSVHSVDLYEELGESLGETRKSLNGLLAFPEASNVVLVLSNKVSNFENFVISRNWRTLTRVSRRIKSKIIPGRTRTPGYFNYDKLSALKRSIENDIDFMTKVTERSVLSREDKIQVLTQLKTLSTELTMLDRYLDHLEKFNSSYKTLKKRYGFWFNKIEPEIALQKIKLDENAKHMLFALVGMIGFLLLSLLGGFWIYSKEIRHGQRVVENIVSDSIRDGLIPMESRMSQNFSTDFLKNFEKHREYIHKRMSFGTVFQEAVPFSCLLLDSNLNMVWANPLFYEHWNMQDRSADDSLSWDFLQQHTNLGEDDPVLLALNEDIAGIYNIQVRSPQAQESLPYEMYVSPVNYSGQKRIMIFFYPLRSLEETLSEQTRAIVGPVSRTLEALTNGSFDQKFRESTEKDFKIAGIGDLFDKFSRYHEFVSQQKNGLLGEIERLENDLYDQFKMADDLRTLQAKAGELKEEIIAHFETARRAIVADIDLRYQLEERYQASLQTAKHSLKTDEELLFQSERANRVLDENIQAFQTVASIRDDFKELKSKVDEYRSTMNRSLDQTMVFVRRDNQDPALAQALERVRMETKGFEKVLGGFTSVTRELDVGLSKVEMILQSCETPDFTELRNGIEQTRKILEDDTFQLGHLGRSGERFDEEVVNSLKSLYTVFQHDRNLALTGQELLQNTIHDAKGDESGDSCGSRHEV